MDNTSIEKRIKPNLEFVDQMEDFLDENFDKMFDEAVNSEDIEFADDDDLIDVEKEDNTINVIINEKRIQNKITNTILNERIEDKLFINQYEKSKNQYVEGYY